ncbi:MAG: type VI secretion system protein TssA [Desulfobacteraceae bacterium]|nr:type VI secretion system protein TssA [Desulfobacteraceae bacterium]MBC2754362.1 type VI secretion system protein TssA [Desulfobacteraceae bacterium]
MDLLSLGKEPISPDQPAGSDVRYEPEFDSLQAEIDKLSSPSAVDSTDWEKVHDLSIKILSTKSKDILVACYLAVSRIHIDQIDGLADGLTILHDMVKLYWDSLFPPRKRMRGRLGAIEFWIEKTESALETIKAGTTNDRWDEINSALAGLDSFLKESLPEPPLLTPIERQVRRLLEQSGGQEKPQEKQSDKDASATSEPAVVAKPESGAGGFKKPVKDPENKESEKDAQKIAQKGFQKIRQAALLIFDENPMDASSYRYRRIAAWVSVSSLPPTNGDKTQIPPPPPHELQNILDLRTSRSWDFLLRSAEHKISQFIFWFDLNRLVAEALINMGEEYISAHQVVCDETAFLLHRLKGLDRLAFSDGTPFADLETRQWINNISLGGGTNPAEQIPIVDSGQVSEIVDQMSARIKEAWDLVKKMKTVEAVGLIHSELQNCNSQKESLFWRMALCRILLGSDKKEMALPHLELLIHDIDNYQLEAWDPGLALSALMIVRTGYSSFTENQLKNKALEILNRIAKIDPVEAMRIGK